MKYKYSTLFLFLCLYGVLISGCALNSQTAGDKVDSMRKGPEAQAQKNMTNMADSLRCMDRLFLEYGIRDMVVLTEDLHDNTKKLSVGGRDMLTSAVSDMTRRSRAVRLITFGGDVSNLVNWLNASGSNSQVYTFKPDFDIRGSISQMDDNLVQQRRGGGITLGPVDLDKTKDANASVIGLDLSIISTQTMELLPGVTTRNSILVVKEGSGFGFGATGSVYKQNFGINYNFSFNSNESAAQAVRTLIELGVIELFGKLTRVPYWNCLGIDQNHPLIKEEIGDWYFTLNRENKLVPYIQNQLRIRNVYSGPVDGSLNPEFQAVVPKARKALGLSEVAQIDEALFSGLINLKSKSIAFPKEPVAHLTVAQLNEKKKPVKKKKRKTRSISDEPEEPESLQINIPKVILSSPAVKPGNEISVSAKSPENTFLYCYFKTADNRLMRIYPNRFTPDPWLGKEKPLQLADPTKFQLKAGATNQDERLYCFNTASDVTPDLPVTARGGDFEPLDPGYDIEALRKDFSVVTSGVVSESSVQILKR
ncbi:MAG: DUF4384 domain-containing protein [Desulfuromonadales bacterium]